MLGRGPYRKLVADLNWTSQQMRQVGLAEAVGGLLLLPRRTRRVGGLLLTATSAIVLLRELQREDNDLALPRAGLLVAALSAVVKP